MKDWELVKLMHKYNAEQREDEVVWFYRHAEKIKPKVIVEIGIKEGGNLKILSTLLDKDGLAIGIDYRQSIPWKMDDCECEIFHVAIDSHSEQAKQQLLEILDGRFIDVLFIDGDHSTSGMILDYDDYSPLVRPGGIIAVHDIYYLEEVRIAWEKVSRDKKKFESPKNQSSIGIGFLIKE